MSSYFFLMSLLKHCHLCVSWMSLSFMCVGCCRWAKRPASSPPSLSWGSSGPGRQLPASTSRRGPLSSIQVLGSDQNSLEALPLLCGVVYFTVFKTQPRGGGAHKKSRLKKCIPFLATRCPNCSLLSFPHIGKTKWRVSVSLCSHEYVQQTFNHFLKLKCSVLLHVMYLNADEL